MSSIQIKRKVSDSVITIKLVEWYRRIQWWRIALWYCNSPFVIDQLNGWIKSSIIRMQFK